MLTLSNTYKKTLTIDGQDVQVRIKKFNKDDALWFRPGYLRIQKDEAAAADELVRFALKWRRRMAEDMGVPVEQVDPPNMIFLSGLLEAELGEDGKRARRAAEDAREAAGNAFCIEAISRFVSVERGQIFDADANREIVNGEDLVAHYIAQPEVMVLLLAEIDRQNKISEHEKKRLSSRSASASTSLASSTGDGPRPVATAEPVASSSTAPTARARARRKTSQSGAMTASSVGSVPS